MRDAMVMVAESEEWFFWNWEQEKASVSHLHTHIDQSRKPANPIIGIGRMNEPAHHLHRISSIIFGYKEVYKWTENKDSIGNLRFVLRQVWMMGDVATDGYLGEMTSMELCTQVFVL